MGYTVTNQFDAKINKEKLHELLGVETWTQFHKRLQDSGMGLGYTGFMNLLNNKPNWSLTYAMIVAKAVDVKVEDLFTLAENN